VKYVLFAILIYVLYQFIFNLVVPIYQASQKIKKGFREMNTHMNQQQSSPSPSSPQTPGPKTKAGDYIEFEEVK
jgi:hypothetical protein